MSNYFFGRNDFRASINDNEMQWTMFALIPNWLEYVWDFSEDAMLSEQITAFSLSTRPPTPDFYYVSSCNKRLIPANF